MIGFFKKREPQSREEPQTALFAVDDRELLLEFEQWAAAIIPLLPKEKAAITTDLQTLERGLRHIIKAMHDPDHKIKQDLRADVMDVLRREQLDQHGLDLLHILRAMRHIILRSAVAAPTQSRSFSVQDDACEELRAQLRTLQEQNDLLNEVIDKLSYHAEVGA